MSLENNVNPWTNLEELISFTEEQILALKKNVERGDKNESNNEEKFEEVWNWLQVLQNNILTANSAQKNQIEKLQKEVDILLSSTQESIAVLKQSVNDRQKEEKRSKNWSMDSYSSPIISLDPEQFTINQVVVAREKASNKVEEQATNWELPIKVTRLLNIFWIRDSTA